MIVYITLKRNNNILFSLVSFGNESNEKGKLVLYETNIMSIHVCKYVSLACC